LLYAGMICTLKELLLYPVIFVLIPML